MRSRRMRAAVALLAMVLAAACTPAASVSTLPAPVLAAHNDTSTPFNLVSLPALRQHRFDGGDLEIGAVLAETPGYTRRSISYVSHGRRIGGIINVPRRSGRLPVVVIAHGWADPATYHSGDGQTREQDHLADAGYVVVQPDYRNFGSSERETAETVRRPLGYPEDLVNLVRALHRADLPYTDLDRVGLLGRSMGGGVALQALVARPHLVDALVLYSPVSSRAADSYRRWVRPDAGLAGKVRAAYRTPAQAPAFWRRASSRSYFDRIDVPVQVHHGTADTVCPVAWSEATTAALRKAGASTELYEYDGEGHRFDAQWSTMITRTTTFFDTHL